MRFQSPDPIGHYFLRYAMPSRFGDVSDDDRRRYGGLLEAHYALVDEAIGRAIARSGPDDLLLVVSGYGMEPLTVEQAGARAGHRRSGDQRLARSGARRFPDGVWRVGGARPPVATRVDRRRVADDSVFPRAAGRARHGRLCASRSCSCRRSPKSVRSRSFPPTTNEVYFVRLFNCGPRGCEEVPCEARPPFIRQLAS